MKYYLLTLLTLLPSLTFGAYSGFESGDLREWETQRLARKSDARLISRPVRNGRFAVAVTLNPGDKSGDGFKSELSDPARARFGRETWYRISHYIPSSLSVAPGNSCVLAQWHNSPAPDRLGGKPPIAHRYRKNGLDITVNFSLKPIDLPTDAIQKTIYSIRPLAKGKWHDFVYRVVWLANQKGRVDLWYQGKLVAKYRGPLGYPTDIDGPYFKAGMYCALSPEVPYTAIFDEFRMGASASSVLLPDEDPKNYK